MIKCNVSIVDILDHGGDFGQINSSFLRMVVFLEGLVFFFPPPSKQWFKMPSGLIIFNVCITRYLMDFVVNLCLRFLKIVENQSPLGYYYKYMIWSLFCIPIPHKLLKFSKNEFEIVEPHFLKQTNMWQISVDY